MVVVLLGGMVTGWERRVLLQGIVKREWRLLVRNKL